MSKNMMYAQHRYWEVGVLSMWWMLWSHDWQTKQVGEQCVMSLTPAACGQGLGWCAYRQYADWLTALTWLTNWRGECHGSESLPFRHLRCDGIPRRTWASVTYGENNNKAMSERDQKIKRSRVHTENTTTHRKEKHALIRRSAAHVMDNTITMWIYMHNLCSCSGWTLLRTN